MTEAQKVNVLIVGSGPAGYTAGVYTGRAMPDPLLIEGDEPGGQLTTTTDVENWPGELTVQGPDLMDRMREQATEAGCRTAGDLVVSLDLSQRPFRAALRSGGDILADAVILATGATAKWLGLPSEQAFRGYGVSACATCDGFLFKDGKVFVVGGGNTAVEEALFLTKYAAKVVLVHRGTEWSAEKVLQKRLSENDKINVLWRHEMIEIMGDDKPRAVRSVRLRDNATGESRTADADGVFIAIGHAPASALVESQLLTHAGGCVWVEPGTTRTSVEGVFAAGDLTDPVYRQAATSAGMGCMAALDMERYLSSH